MSQSNDIAGLIRRNWMRVTDEVRQAAVAAGRAPDSVRVIGVSKYVDAATTRLLFDAGCCDLGESRPQVLWQKAETVERAVPENANRSLRWHMIGHVQTNKLRRMLPLGPLIHSVDSERILRAIDGEAHRQERVAEVLLEVNISGDENKTGLSPDAVGQLLEIPDLNSVRIIGLMAMAGWGTEPSQAASQFQDVAQLRDRLVASGGHTLPELSMGMSGDFREAIAAGATMVRIGSALFEGVR
ncbi:Pyridoxal phosphate homeostasis protein [Stieleria maiorica]|uniref:Pyridoxal phosphate homeostasis protein n=1 Tax=Stieleria maiorica TaxID=2795974 RepID=A0A5B9M9V0_9BACT|nr:YggS family pyridoxal phosphate-dependent enzyme [Stieleria maiorica]QEF96840.1 Pyridoxal phosphate homeostasis protein [Stieleria maiorica]